MENYVRELKTTINELQTLASRLTRLNRSEGWLDFLLSILAAMLKGGNL